MKDSDIPLDLPKAMVRLAKEVAVEWVDENAYRVAAAAAIPVPVPGAHTILCTAIEAYMIYNIAKIYGVPMTVAGSVAMIPALGGAVVAGKGLSAVVGEAATYLPFAGWLLKGAVSGATAYAIGRATITYFSVRYPSREGAPFQSESLKDFISYVFQQFGVKLP